MRVFGFSWLFPKSLNILQIFLHILIGNVKGFHKMYIKPYFGKNKLCTFLYKFTTQKNSRVFANVHISSQIISVELSKNV